MTPLLPGFQEKETGGQTDMNEPIKSSLFSLEHEECPGLIVRCLLGIWRLKSSVFVSGLSLDRPISLQR
jgi:hypothetical protein